MSRRTVFAWCFLSGAFVLAAAQQSPAPQTPNPPLFKGDKPKKDDASRSVSGIVRDSEDKPAGETVVKVKDTKTLTIRSFITKEDGAYNFQGLSGGVDYELKAETRDGASSPVKILSVYDNRKAAIINLKLDAKK